MSTEVLPERRLNDSDQSTQATLRLWSPRSVKASPATGRWVAGEGITILFGRVSAIDENGLTGNPPAIGNEEADKGDDILNIRQARLAEG